MKLKDFDYAFPDELIAKKPPEERDSSRMMVVDRKTGSLSHQSFKQIVGFFEEGDVLVMNDSKVFPCRLKANIPTGAAIELLLLRDLGDSVWEALISRSKKVTRGMRFAFSPDLSAEIIDDFNPQNHMAPRRLRFSAAEPVLDILEREAHVPLPPYLKREDAPDDRERYQTVYAAKTGSVAAPTAGFHFTPEILAALRQKGVKLAFVTLHVGIGTFLPVRCEEIKDHKMHGEFYEIPDETRRLILEARQTQKRVTVVGTTAVRALESAWDEDSGLKAGPGYTEKFIYPPYEFKTFDRLLTNFHQPESTLLILVSALAGEELIRRAYREAISERYRLFSYGDCMLIV